jgi:hypothetical protein
MIGYKLSETLYRVPVADYSNGNLIDGYTDIGPDDPNFEKWGKFVVPMPDDGDEGNGAKSGAGAPPSGGGGAQQQQRMELRRWERKALRSLKDGRSPMVRFQSDLLAPETFLEVNQGLHRSEDAEGVRRVFADAIESLEDLFPPVYHTSAQAWERQQIAAKWRERRVKAEREA